MMHILEDRFYQWVFADTVASAEETAHLAACADCQAQLVTLQRMAEEFQVARASTPTDAALNRYFALFSEIEQLPSLVQRLGELIIAQLQWDGRRQPAWQGVRNAQVASYRLLYATEQAEIELRIVPQDGQFQVEGEVIALADDHPFAPSTCEVHATPIGSLLTSAACDADGRFRLGTLSAGAYQLHFVPAPAAATIVIDKLELG